MNYFLIVRITLGHTLFCMVRADNSKDAVDIATSVMKNSSGRYYTFKITKHDYDLKRATWAKRFGEFEYQIGTSGKFRRGQAMVYFMDDTLNVNLQLKGEKIGES